MIQIELSNAYKLKKLFGSLTDSCVISCFEGFMGTAFADNKDNPLCCAVLLGEYFYIGGSSDSTDFLKEAFEYAKENSLIIVTLNENIQTLIKTLYSDKCKFVTRYQMDTNPKINESCLSEIIGSLPKEFELTIINENIYNQALKNEWSAHFCCNFKNYKDFSEHAVGYAVLHNGKIVSGTSSYSYYSNGYEVVIATSPEYRRRGLAIVSASAYLLECTKRNKTPHWDAANEKSLALSQKIGYSLLRRYYGIKLL